MATVTATYESATSSIVFRDRNEIKGFFDGLDMVEPGLVRPWQWHTDTQAREHTNWLYAGVGRKLVDGVCPGSIPRVA